MSDSTPPVPPVPPAPSGDGSTPAATPPAAPPPAAPAAPTYPAYGQQAPAAYGPPTNTLSIVAMILSLAGLITGITAIIGAILGHVALGQIKRTGENGRGFALTGIIVGWVLTAIGIIGIIAVIAFYAWIFTTYGTSTVYNGF